MLHRDPSKRPSVKKILEKEFLAEKITSLLSNTVAKHEFRSIGMQQRNELPQIDKEDKVSSSMVVNGRDNTNKSFEKKAMERPASVNSHQRGDVRMSPKIISSHKSPIHGSAKKEDSELDNIDKKSIVHPDKAYRPLTRDNSGGALKQPSQPIRGKVTLYGEVKGKSPSRPITPNELKKPEIKEGYSPKLNDISP